MRLSSAARALDQIESPRSILLLRLQRRKRAASAAEARILKVGGTNAVGTNSAMVVVGNKSETGGEENSRH